MFVHVVWATHLRRPAIKPAIEPELHHLMAERCIQLGIRPLAINGMQDHIHVLVSLSPTAVIPRIVGILKGFSSHAIDHGLLPERGFRWQRGYSVFSVSPSAVHTVVAYIENQKRHHAPGGVALPHCEP
jgi:REP element-mobilizing transposase RayT